MRPILAGAVERTEAHGKTYFVLTPEGSANLGNLMRKSEIQMQNSSENASFTTKEGKSVTTGVEGMSYKITPEELDAITDLIPDEVIDDIDYKDPTAQELTEKAEKEFKEEPSIESADALISSIEKEVQAAVEEGASEEQIAAIQKRGLEAVKQRNNLALEGAIKSIDIAAKINPIILVKIFIPV